MSNATREMEQRLVPLLNRLWRQGLEVISTSALCDAYLFVYDEASRAAVGRAVKAFSRLGGPLRQRSPHSPWYFLVPEVFPLSESKRTDEGVKSCQEVRDEREPVRLSVLPQEETEPAPKSYLPPGVQRKEFPGLFMLALVVCSRNTHLRGGTDVSLRDVDMRVLRWLKVPEERIADVRKCEAYTQCYRFLPYLESLEKIARPAQPRGMVRLTPVGWAEIAGLLRGVKCDAMQLPAADLAAYVSTFAVEKAGLERRQIWQQVKDTFCKAYADHRAEQDLMGEVRSGRG